MNIPIIPFKFIQINSCMIINRINVLNLLLQRTIHNMPDQKTILLSISTSVFLMLFRSITIFSNNITTIIIITNKPIAIVFIQTSRIIFFLCSFISSKEYSIPVLALDTEFSNIIYSTSCYSTSYYLPIIF